MHKDGEKIILDPCFAEDAAALNCIKYGLAMRRGRAFDALWPNEERFDDRLEKATRPFSDQENEPLVIDPKEFDVSTRALNEGIAAQKEVPGGLLFWTIPKHILLAEDIQQSFQSLTQSH